MVLKEACMGPLPHRRTKLYSTGLVRPYMLLTGLLWNCWLGVQSYLNLQIRTYNDNLPIFEQTSTTLKFFVTVVKKKLHATSFE